MSNCNMADRQIKQVNGQSLQSIPKNLLNFIWKYFSSSDSDAIVLRKSLIKICSGSHTSALMLSQLIYWHNKYKDIDRWMKITYDEWYEQILLTKRQISYAREKLEPLGIVEFKVKKFNNIPSCHYRVNFEKLYQLLINMDTESGKEQNVTMESDKMLQPKVTKCNYPITENTTQPTTEKTTTTPPPSNTAKTNGGGSFNSFEKQCLKLRVPTDTREPQEFIENVYHHIEHNSPSENPPEMRRQMIVKLLKMLNGQGAVFHSKGYDSRTDKIKMEKQKLYYEMVRMYNEYVGETRSLITLGHKPKDTVILSLMNGLAPVQVKSSPRACNELTIAIVF